MLGQLWHRAVDFTVPLPGASTIKYCRNLIKKPWAYNPKIVSRFLRNPNKGPRFLNQVPTLLELRVADLRVGKQPCNVRRMKAHLRTAHT